MDAETAAALADLNERVSAVTKSTSFLERNAEVAVPSDAPVEVAWSTSSSLAAGAEVEVTVTLPMACAVTRVVTSRATRGRLYDRAAKSTADASRASGVYPSGDSGLLLEWDGGTAAEDFGVNPKAIVANLEGSTSYKLRVKNLSAAGAVITGSFWVVF